MHLIYTYAHICHIYIFIHFNNIYYQIIYITYICTNLYTCIYTLNLHIYMCVYVKNLLHQRIIRSSPRQLRSNLKKIKITFPEIVN